MADFVRVANVFRHSHAVPPRRVPHDRLLDLLPCGASLIGRAAGRIVPRTGEIARLVQTRPQKLPINRFDGALEALEASVLLKRRFVHVGSLADLDHKRMADVADRRKGVRIRTIERHRVPGVAERLGHQIDCQLARL